MMIPESKRIIRVTNKTNICAFPPPKKHINEYKKHSIMYRHTIQSDEMRGSLFNKSQAAKQDFRTKLLKKFGNFFRAWRLGLDFNGDLELSFDEFCTALQQMKFACDIPMLWKAFDLGDGEGEGAGDGCLTLHEIDAATGAMMIGWRAWIYERYGGPLNFFRELDKHQSGGAAKAQWDPEFHQPTVSKHYFICGLTVMGCPNFWPENTKAETFGQIYDGFCHPDRQTMQASDLVYLEENEFARKYMINPNDPEVKRIMRTREQQLRQRVLTQHSQETAKTCFIELCKMRCGTLIRAWRKEIDKKCNMEVSRDDFIQASTFFLLILSCHSRFNIQKRTIVGDAFKLCIVQVLCLVQIFDFNFLSCPSIRK
jgi:hypothetical protein